MLRELTTDSQWSRQLILLLTSSLPPTVIMLSPVRQVQGVREILVPVILRGPGATAAASQVKERRA